MTMFNKNLYSIVLLSHHAQVFPEKQKRDDGTKESRQLKRRPEIYVDLWTKIISPHQTAEKNM